MRSPAGQLGTVGVERGLDGGEVCGGHDASLFADEERWPSPHRRETIAFRHKPDRRIFHSVAARMPANPASKHECALFLLQLIEGQFDAPMSDCPWATVKTGSRHHSSSFLLTSIFTVGGSFSALA